MRLAAGQKGKKLVGLSNPSMMGWKIFSIGTVAAGSEKVAGKFLLKLHCGYDVFGMLHHCCTKGRLLASRLLGLYTDPRCSINTVTV